VTIPTQSRSGAALAAPLPVSDPVESYRARLAEAVAAHWRSECPCCGSAHPCAEAAALLGLLEFTA